MSLTTLQNFYKETIAVACSTGATNIYVSTKPTVSSGWLVISPGKESLREIVKFSSTGTDGTGDYVVIADAADRGLGGTTDQTHAIGEKVRMNYTAQHQQETSDAIDQIVAAGAQDASTSTKGIVKMSTAPVSATEPIAVGDNDPRLNATTGLTSDEEDALVGDGGTPSASNPFKLKSRTLTAGATIAGATTPVPVYQNTTDNELYACDADDTSALKFIGFVISDGDDGDSVQFQEAGVVSGFTSLDEGTAYYVQDAIGTIGTTPGTNPVLVGIAISETEFLIQKGKRHASGVGSFSASGTDAITIGFRPTKIRVKAIMSGNAIVKSDGTWIAGAYKCLFNGDSNGSQAHTAQTTTSYVGYILNDLLDPDYHQLTITSVTETGFTITNTKVGSLNDVYYIWEAEGEL